MSGFHQALPFVLAQEGGYSDHPDDPGGATNKGITQAVYDEWLDSQAVPRRPVRYIAEAEVEAIYHRRYWLAGRCDSLPWPASLAHFDACVNHGIRNATKLLQRALGVEADGVVGPVTEGAIVTADWGKVLPALLWTRTRFYCDICQARPASRVFLLGWIRRVLALRDRVL
jgi:lysozyme family protein